MTYTAAFIEGSRELYKDMLRAVRLRSRDALYVLGDIIGESGGIGVLCDMMYRSNVFPLLGDRELEAQRYLRRIGGAADAESCFPCSPEGEWLRRDFLLWRAENMTFLDEFMELSPDRREDVLDYLSEFALYDELECGGRGYVLVHTGFDCAAAESVPESCTPEEVTRPRPSGAERMFSGRTVISAHRPRGVKDTGGIWYSDGHVALEGEDALLILRPDDGLVLRIVR